MRQFFVDNWVRILDVLVIIVPAITAYIACAYAPVFLKSKNARRRFETCVLGARIEIRFTDSHGRPGYRRDYNPDPYEVMEKIVERRDVSPWARMWGKSRIIDLINDVYERNGWQTKPQDPLLHKYLHDAGK